MWMTSGGRRHTRWLLKDHASSMQAHGTKSFKTILCAAGAATVPTSADRPRHFCEADQRPPGAKIAIQTPKAINPIENEYEAKASMLRAFQKSERSNGSVPFSEPDASGLQSRSAVARALLGEIRCNRVSHLHAARRLGAAFLRKEKAARAVTGRLVSATAGS
jgi:hypothetical protein